MERKAVSGMMVTLLLISMLTLAFNFQPVKTEPTTILVPDDYPTIQEAINHANAGDTIFVKKGTYYEHVVVNKSVSMIGENTVLTIIDGTDTGSVVKIVANNVTMSGFVIQRSGTWPDSGISLDQVSGCYVYSNIVRNNTMPGPQNVGIGLWGSSRNRIFGNNLSSGRSGIVVAYSSNDNWIANNTLPLPNGAILGIQIYESEYNHVANNTIVNAIGGIWVAGIRNVAFGNTVLNNTYGVEIYAGSSNNFYHNNFINNTLQVHFYVPSSNSWDNGYPSGSNYWSDYNGGDSFHGSYQDVTGSDGIGDTPYIIDVNNQDRYPLMSPYEYWSNPIPGDTNKDTKVNYQDLFQLAVAYGSDPSKPNWNPSADINGDGRVNYKDLYTLAINYGKTYP